MEEMLKEEDVRRLLASPDAGIRAEIAGKIASQHPALTETQRKLAEDIFRIMVKDAEVRVREALAQQLKANPLVPHDVALTLAQDVGSVALPILQFSEVLTDNDLLELVKIQDHDKLAAMAQRSHISADLSDALVNSGDGGVVATLVSNRGAELRETTLKQVVDQYSDGTTVSNALAERPGLPVTIVERLLNRVSENIRAHLLRRKDLSPEMATTLLIQAREQAVLGISNTESDVVKLVAHLHKHKRLTPSIILRAVCMGDMVFFETALAKLAEITVPNAQALIYDEGKRGFQALYQKSGLPQTLYPAMRAAIDISRGMKLDGEANDRERFSRKMIERILTQYGEQGVEFESDDLDYLMVKMGQLPTTAPPPAE
ncbi:MAG TPA: DUF2336 domain-containing protein [Candidatus Sulfotelmatobacter sp.]|nr:DUF2336 domain-containing protein [Candidatus Sulfotelmatobacter sp.]